MGADAATTATSAAGRPRNRLRDRIARAWRGTIAIVDRLNGTRAATALHEPDYQHVMRITDT